MMKSRRLSIIALLAYVSCAAVAQAEVDSGDLVVTDLFGLPVNLTVFDSTGALKDTFDLLSCSPFDVGIDIAGTIFVSGGQTEMVYRLAPGASPDCTLVGHTVGPTALGITVAPSGILYVADGSAIVAIDPGAYDPGDPDANREIVGSGGDLLGANDVALDADGVLFVATTQGPIVRVDPDAYEPGNPTSNQTRVGLGAASNGAEIAIGPTGELFVVETSVSSRIVRYDPSSFDPQNPAANQLATYTGFSLPTTVAFDSTHQLLVLDSGGVFRLDPALGTTSLLAPGTFGTPFARLAVAPTPVAAVPALGPMPSGILVALLGMTALWSLATRRRVDPTLSRARRWRLIRSDRAIRRSSPRRPRRLTGMRAMERRDPS